jgi:hypothetical protein
MIMIDENMFLKECSVYEFHSPNSKRIYTFMIMIHACAVAGLHVLKLIPQLTVVDLLYAQQQLCASHEATDVGFVILLLLLLHQKENAE